jgi:hypothetical protein
MFRKKNISVENAHFLLDPWWWALAPITFFTAGPASPKHADEEPPKRVM